MTALHLISDFNATMLARYLESTDEPEAESLSVTEAPFGQLHRVLMAGPSDRMDAAIVWTRPEGALPSFQDVLGLKRVDESQVLADVEAFAGLVLKYAEKVPSVLVVAWSLPPTAPNYGMLDYQPGLGVAQYLARANLHLSECLAKAPSVFVLDPERWIRASMPHAFSTKLWLATKSPFGNGVYKEAARFLRAALNGIAGRSRKLLVLDLDNTLWGGVVGETGWQGVRLGGHDHVGEAFVAFQTHLAALQKRGIQLALLSKNDEAVALEVFEKHPEMVLRREDLAGWRINWGDKASNLTELMAELNLGLHSAVFIDDMPVERARVRDALPQVLVPEWPKDPAQYVDALARLDCFQASSLTSEDRGRARMYASERERKATQSLTGNLEDWLRGLHLVVEVEQLGPSNITRATQLLNKTNQLNLQTRRLSEKGFADWAAEGKRVVLTFRVSDSFGEAGLTGLLSVETQGSVAQIRDFVMSCRVMGRGVENVMFAVAVAHARATGAETLSATYIRTERNNPTLEILHASGFHQEADGLFLWKTSEVYPEPEFIELRRCAAPVA